MSAPGTSAPTPALTEAEPSERLAGVRRRRRRVTFGSVLVTVLRYIALIISAVLFLLPVYLILRNALSKDTDITAPGWTLFPSSCTTVQVALSTFLTAQTINLHELFLAAACLHRAAGPCLRFLQRYLVQGVVETGIKG